MKPKSRGGGRPKSCPVRITEGPHAGQLCGKVGDDWAPLKMVKSFGGKLLGWQCRRGHVIGKPNPRKE